MPEAEKRIVITEALKYIESAEMREYLQSPAAPMHPGKWSHIIAAARAPLAEKAAVLRIVAERYEWEEDDLYNPAIMADAADDALREAYNPPSGSVFMLTQSNRSLPWAIDDHWRFDDDREHLWESNEVFATFEQAMTFIAEEMDFEADKIFSDDEIEEIDYTMYWNEICRYDMDKSGKLARSYTWFVGDSGTIWGFEPDRGCSLGNRELYAFSSRKELYLPLPFQPGDIITYDIRPFYGVFHCLILSNISPFDCCSPQVAYMCDYGQLNVRSFHHLSAGYPAFSPSLRAELFTGKLPRREEPLRILSGIIREKPEVAEPIWNFIAEERGNKSLRNHERNRNRDCAPKKGAAWRDISAAFAAP